MNLANIESPELWSAELDSRNIGGADFLKALASSSYSFFWHPLGFVMCKLANKGPTSLRVHVWPNSLENQQQPAWLIHDHLFSLKSWVLAGEIENREYSVDFSGLDHAIYETRYEEGNSLLQKSTQYCSKKLERTIVVNEGETYKVKSGVFHQSLSLSDRVSLTVCETNDDLARAPRVLGSSGGEYLYSYRRRAVTRSEINDLIKRI